MSDCADATQTNVPYSRVAYRYEMLREEIQLIGAGYLPPVITNTPRAKSQDSLAPPPQHSPSSKNKFADASFSISPLKISEEEDSKGAPYGSGINANQELAAAAASAGPQGALFSIPTVSDMPPGIISKNRRKSSSATSNK